MTRPDCSTTIDGETVLVGNRTLLRDAGRRRASVTRIRGEPAMLAPRAGDPDGAVALVSSVRRLVTAPLAEVPANATSLESILLYDVTLHRRRSDYGS